MPEVIQGNATVVVPTKGAGTHIVIVATTNATPVVIETFGAHGFYSGDSIEVEGTGIATVDGLWVVTVLTSTTFELNGSTAPGSASILGYCINYEVQPALQVPLPGEPASAVTSIPPLQGLANTEPWHYRNSGKYRLYNVYTGLVPASPGINLAYSSAWTFISSVSASETNIPKAGFSLDLLLNGNPGSGAAPIVGPNDFLDVSLSMSLYISASGAVSGSTANLGLAAYQPTQPIDYIPIASSTAATPIVVATTAPHGLATGNAIGIVAAPLNVLNNFWLVTVIDATHFSLQGSSSGTAQGAGGYVVSLPNATVLTPTNWPVVPVATTTGPYSSVTVRGFFGQNIGGPSAVTPTAPLWICPFVTPNSPSPLAEVALLGPAMATVYHYRAN